MISKKQKYEMIKSLKKEIIQRKKELTNQKIKTIYFGGGTPSILKNNEIATLLKQIYNTYYIQKNAEITIECNPDDLTLNKLLSYKEIGFNRLSIGIQSFNKNELQFMNRAHNAQEALLSIELAKKAGFNNITIDLIYGLPNQTLKDWKKNLDIMFSLNIQHFAAYSLTIEKKTALYHLIKKQKVTALTDKKIISQFNYLQKKAKEKGFVHYEISNFGKKGYFSRHNSSYWKGDNYLGIGPSAHSYNGTRRRWNIASNKKYISNINNGISYFEEEFLTKNQQYNEYVFTSLRTIWGIDNTIIKKKYGVKIELYFLTEIKKWEKKKYVNSKANIYKLTKRGKIFADLIASDLFIVD